jgi:hypothetical protein
MRTNLSLSSFFFLFLRFGDGAALPCGERLRERGKRKIGAEAPA